jgi:phospholipase/carboxylesterase
MLARMADPERMRGLPIHVVHGALDWMFPVEVAREARDALAAAGAAVRLLEIADLSHCYPREVGGAVLEWVGV